jgi:LmbE family N-acetylglucosaminyl deacetylase
VLTSYDSLLVLAPHPDDETLGFAGLTRSYMDHGKPVDVVVTTDGDAYCEACRFWKTSSVHGDTCSASELSNFATPGMDSFGEVRRAESAAAAEILGRGAPTFFGYPDTGLGSAWTNFNAGEPDEPLRRSDFSECKDCVSCGSGYGGGPVTNLTANTLIHSLRQKIVATSENVLLATTHWLDGHADHSALGNFVKMLNAELPKPRAIAFAVIHANTPKTTPHPDCWYPAPQALVCPCDSENCATKDPQWVSLLSNYRFHPDWPSALPDDIDYGEAKQLCLPETQYKGENATKLKAVRSYKSQLGFLARNGSHPDAFAGMLDCNGYLISFVRRTETFVLLTE